VAEEKVSSFVYDLDTTMRFPEDFDKYYKAVFDFPRAAGEGNEGKLKVY